MTLNSSQTDNANRITFYRKLKIPCTQKTRFSTISADKIGQPSDTQLLVLKLDFIPNFPFSIIFLILSTVVKIIYL